MARTVTKTNDTNVAHAANAHAQHFGPQSWEIRGTSEESPYSDDHRACSYCGSMHPADMLAYVKAGARFSFADMKYGTPHKIYVDEIPNACAGKPLKHYTICGVRPANEDGWEEYETGLHRRDNGARETAWRKLTSTSVAPATRPGKFYTEHLLDADEETFIELTQLIMQRSGVQFVHDKDRGMMFTINVDGV